MSIQEIKELTERIEGLVYMRSEMAGLIAELDSKIKAIRGPLPDWRSKVDFQDETETMELFSEDSKERLFNRDLIKVSKK